jgi:hypothetical protein
MNLSKRRYNNKNVTLLATQAKSSVSKACSSGHGDPGKSHIRTKCFEPKAHSVHIIRLNIECLT